MTDPTRPRPVPGPPRPGPAGVPVAGGLRVTGPAVAPPPPVDGDPDGRAAASLAGLDQRPVAEHVAVFEAEHDRLQRELGTIDQL